jgi:hypothetical protein
MEMMELWYFGSETPGHPLSHVQALVPIVQQARSEAHPLGLLTAALGSGFIAK